MILGQVVHGLAREKATYYSPWMSVGGNLAVMACEVVSSANVDQFAITVQTKTRQQSDASANSFVPLGGSANVITVTDETVTEFNVGTKLSDTVNNGFEELFRYVYEVSGTDAKPAWVHFRMLNPAWMNN